MSNSPTKHKYQLIYEVEVDDPRQMARIAVELYSNASIFPVKITKQTAEIPFDITTFMEFGIHNNYDSEEEFINKCKQEGGNNGIN